MNPETPFFFNWWKPICFVPRRVRAGRVSIVPETQPVSSPFIRMQGGQPGPVNWAKEQRQDGNWSGAMNPLLSTFPKQDSDHLLKNSFCPCVPYKETGNFRGKKGPQSLTGWPRKAGVMEGAGRR